MPISTTIFFKSVAAVLATGLGALGGFNYVTAGSTNDFKSPTSISSVSAGFAAPAELLPAPQESAAPCSASAEHPKVSADSPSCHPIPSDCTKDQANCPVGNANEASDLEIDFYTNEG